MASGEARHLAVVAEVDNWLLDQRKPDIFDEGSAENVLTAAKRRFGRLCAALAEQGYPHPHELMLFDFHSAVEYLTEKNRSSSE